MNFQENTRPRRDICDTYPGVSGGVLVRSETRECIKPQFPKPVHRGVFSLAVTLKMPGVTVQAGSSQRLPGFPFVGFVVGALLRTSAP